VAILVPSTCAQYPQYLPPAAPGLQEHPPIGGLEHVGVGWDEVVVGTKEVVEREEEEVLVGRLEVVLGLGELVIEVLQSVSEGSHWLEIVVLEMTVVVMVLVSLNRACAGLETMRRGIKARVVRNGRNIMICKMSMKVRRGSKEIWSRL